MTTLTAAKTECPGGPSCPACAIAHLCGWNPKPSVDVNRRCNRPKGHKGRCSVPCAKCGGTGRTGGAPNAGCCKGTGRVSLAGVQS